MQGQTVPEKQAKRQRLKIGCLPSAFFEPSRSVFRAIVWF
jgi:hypothetical protein